MEILSPCSWLITWCSLTCSTTTTPCTITAPVMPAQRAKSSARYHPLWRLWTGRLPRRHSHSTAAKLLHTIRDLSRCLYWSRRTQEREDQTLSEGDRARGTSPCLECKSCHHGAERIWRMQRPSTTCTTVSTRNTSPSHHSDLPQSHSRLHNPYDFHRHDPCQGRTWSNQPNWPSRLCRQSTKSPKGWSRKTATWKRYFSSWSKTRQKLRVPSAEKSSWFKATRKVTSAPDQNRNVDKYKASAHP